ncbi:MAG TPA: ester cyclase, partial [Caldilineaceae bacterium]|nr:ester cyclase [Caldilineaceae bacterium]
LRLTESGTMVGSLRGIAPTGRQYTIPAVQIFRLTNGKLVEMWGFRDTGSMMQQLGITLPPPSAQ